MTTAHKRIAILSLALTVVSIMLPTLVSAEGLLEKAGGVLNTLIGLFIALAVVVFFWGLVKWLWSMGPDDAQQGLKIMFWGVVAIFVMISIWGVVRLLQESLLEGSDTEKALPPPKVDLGGPSPAEGAAGARY